MRFSVVLLADLRVSFGMPASPATQDARRLVLDLTLDDEQVTVAILADRVHCVTRISTASNEPIPSVVRTWPPAFVTGLVKLQDGFVLLPDFTKIFSQEIAATTAIAGHIIEGF